MAHVRNSRRVAGVPGVRGGPPEPVPFLREGGFSPGIHIGMCTDVNGGFADLMPAHDSMLFKVPDRLTDEQVVFADPFAVSLHAVTRHPPHPGARCSCTARVRSASAPSPF